MNAPDITVARKERSAFRVPAPAKIIPRISFHSSALRVPQQIVARKERSAFRGASPAKINFPGFHFIASGLRVLRKVVNVESGQKT